MNKKYYPQAYLCQCKYQIRKKRMENLINDDLDLSFSDSEFESDYESCSEYNDSEEYILEILCCFRLYKSALIMMINNKAGVERKVLYITVLLYHYY